MRIASVNDPVKTNAVWVGGDYLNVSFMFNYGGVQPHAINLVKNMLDESSSTKQHRTGVSAQTRMIANNIKFYEGFVCFDLRPFACLENTDSVKLSVKVKEFIGETTYDVILQVQSRHRELATEMPIYL